jgi:uncharacterized membrane protein
MNLTASPANVATDSPASAMNAARESIVVNASTAEVYRRWSRFEDLPTFIKPLRNVQRIDEAHFFYMWQRDGHEQQGVLHIVLQIPERRIAWRSTSNGFVSGVVCFEPRSNTQTKITLKIRSIFDPPRLSARVREYLDTFKNLIEIPEVSS